MDRLNKLFLATLAAVSLVAAGLQVPAFQEKRAAAADSRASEDLTSLRLAVSDYAYDQNKLPTALDGLELEDDVKGRLGNYEYKPGDDGAYQLCATFQSDTSRSSQDDDGFSSYSSYYEHKKGRHCFDEKVTLLGSGGNFDYDFDFDFDSDSGSGSGSDIFGLAGDTEIQADINVIYGQLEAYYAENGFYPSASDLESRSWWDANMPGMDDDAANGPNGEMIGAGYDYTPSPSGCSSNCTSYTLTAKLSDSSSYTKQSY